MPGPTSDPNLSDNLRAAAQAAVACVNVAAPATVVSYDRVSQSATVKIVPSFKRRNPSNDGAIESYRVPPIANVPVAFPGSGAVSMTWPLSAGDTGLIVFADRSIDEWTSTGSSETTPQDTRRHNVSDAIFIPGLRSFADPIPASGHDAAASVWRAAEIRLGSSTASDFVALASLVSAELAAIWTVLNAHIHPGAGLPPTPGVPPGPPTIPGAAGAVASTKVKAE